LDFNECLANGDFRDWHSSQEFLTHDLIDYYEDPTPFDPKAWRSWSEKGLRLAVDITEAHSNADLEESGVRVIVLKPARINIIEWLKKLPKGHKYEFVVTHYMDTLLGITTAVSSALKLKFFVKDRLTTCGLLPSENVVLSNYFKNPLLTSGPHLMPKEDKGCGWTEELGHVPWQLL
jgi:L-alanine-DL-glutamate epimerase-like enolase superfamily enzyme